MRETNFSTKTSEEEREREAGRKKEDTLRGERPTVNKAIKIQIVRALQEPRPYRNPHKIPYT